LEPKQEAEAEEEVGGQNRNGTHASPAGVPSESPRRKKRKRDKKRKGNDDVSVQEGYEVEKSRGKGDFDESDLDRVPGYAVLLCTVCTCIVVFHALYMYIYIYIYIQVYYCVLRTQCSEHSIASALAT